MKVVFASRIQLQIIGFECLIGSHFGFNISMISNISNQVLIQIEIGFGFWISHTFQSKQFDPDFKFHIN